jgi:hypothetical protein
MVAIAIEYTHAVTQEEYHDETWPIVALPDRTGITCKVLHNLQIGWQVVNVK